MAFKMNPKSPVLMATGKFESPAKNMNKGYGPAKTSSPAKQLTDGTKKPPLTELEKAKAAAAEAELKKKISNIKRNTSTVQKETATDKKRTARNNSKTQRRTKNATKTQKRIDERNQSNKTRAGKVIAKVKKVLVSPVKKNGMKYDIKEASNQNLTAKARKHFAENAQHDSKKGSR